MLCTSRKKYVPFLEKPFTRSVALEADEAVFKYFGGITKEVVYGGNCSLLGSLMIMYLKLTKGKTDVLISHHFLTVRMVDCI